MTVTRAVIRLVHHPVRFLRDRWNWKAAIVSASMRGAIYFGATIGFGFSAAAWALLVDAATRVPMAGACAGVIQEVRCAEPRWQAIAVAAFAVPAAAELVEIVTHSVGGTPLLWRAVAISTGFSMISSMVELSLMRHRIMLVGRGSDSLRSDVRRLVELLKSSR